MGNMFPMLLFMLGSWSTNIADADLDTAAITVYRNPEFFKHLSEEFNNHLHQFTKEPIYGPRDEYESPVDEDTYISEYNKPEEGENHDTDENYEEPQEQEEDNANHSAAYRDEENEELEDKEEQQQEPDDDEEGYKYPGEPKKHNPKVPPNVDIHFDGSPDFHHPPRDLPKPKKPKKKGRGPYGHPRYVENHDSPPSYHKEYENERKKSEEAQLAEIEEESRRHRNGGDTYRQGAAYPQEKYELYHRHYPADDYYKDELPLKVYHQGQRYPITTEEYVNHEDIHYPERYHKPPLKYHNYPAQEIRETEKGTREYLKHHRLPPNHELEDLRSERQRTPKHVVKVSCDTVVKPKQKKRKTYIAYRVRPVYSQYRVVPFKPKKLTTIYISRPNSLYKRSPTPRENEDNSAYIVNSEADGEFEKL